MAAPGCGIIFAPSQRIDRSSSLRRSRSLNSRPKPLAAPKQSMHVYQGHDMTFTHAHSRSLSDKMRNLHRKKNSNGSDVSTRTQQSMASATQGKKNPKYLDLMEAASQQDPSRKHSGGYRDVGIGKENAVLGTNLSRPAVSKMEQNSRQIAYDQYLTEAFGLHKLDKPKPASVQRLKALQDPDARPESDMSSRTTDSMEVLFHIHPTDLPAANPPATNLLPPRQPRPHLSVTIPGKTTSTKQPRSTAHLVHQIDRQKTKGRSARNRARGRQTQISPPSSSAAQSDEAPARMSIVSPLSSVQMPKPRRPFSAWSLEEMTHDVPDMPKSAPAVEKSTSSDSSDAGDHDDGSSNYSGRSSMSSLSDETALEKPDDRNHSVAFSICSPAAAGVFDGRPLTPKAQRELRMFKSSASLGMNMNKPLPPEPGMADVTPLNVPGCTRPGSVHGKRNAPSPLTISRNSFIESPAQMPSRMSSLRSRYTPADLDALDAAFAKTNQNLQAAFYSQTEPSLSQAQMELEAHLGTINEEPALNQTSAPAVHDPLQISRGPNTMVPSRQAPPPPSSLKLSDGSVSNRKRLHKKAATHVALQMRAESIKDSSESEAGSERKKRIAGPARAGSFVKANKILGKEGPVVMQREASADSGRSSSDSPHVTSDDSSSPTMSREDSSTPDTDISSVPDHAFEEVRARLELLSPKNDSKQPTSVETQLEQTTWSRSIRSPKQEESVSATSHAASVPPRKDSLAPEIHVTPIDETKGLRLVIPAASDDALDESDIHPLQRRGTKPDEPRPRSLASIAMSEIPDIYASLPSPALTIDTVRQSMTSEEVERMISADAAEKVLLRILQNLDNLQDLFATAVVSRGFYRTFKRHELPLMKNALYAMSPAAWELREISLQSLTQDENLPTLGYTPSLYLQHYMRDMYTMIALKSMILIHCESFLRADTITALAGGETERASQIDDAFWRVWTFCQLFGCGSGREDDIVGQMDWLRGGHLAAQQRQNANASTLGSEVDRTSVLYSSPTSFGRGNVGGLSTEDLYDMTEIWTCLGVLVRGFQGKRQEARDHGIFENADVAAGDIEKEDSVLEEWTYHLLTLAPPAVLDVTSPTTPTAATFAHARSRGFTDWTPPTISSATFLKEAVSRVYEEKVALGHSPAPTSSPAAGSPTIAIHPVSPHSQPASVDDTIAARWRCARHAAEIRAKRNDPSFNLVPTSEDRPMSEFPDVIKKLDANATSSAPAPSPLSSATHNRTPSEEDTAKNFVSALVVPAGPQVRDPVDVAVEQFVAMGFDKVKAGKALAETDTGNSIDFAAAMEWLVRERKRDVSGLMHATYRGPIGGERNEISAPVSPEAVIRDAVEMGMDVGRFE
ncbi:hypothetical protein ACLMJK_001204 [Lecanora helva]